MCRVHRRGIGERGHDVFWIKESMPGAEAPIVLAHAHARRLGRQFAVIERIESVCALYPDGDGRRKSADI
jgi:hypothetical protein